MLDRSIPIVARRVRGTVDHDRHVRCGWNDSQERDRIKAQFLALHRFILDGTIHAGDNLLLVSGASGIVISHATYTLDDLPDRYRKQWVCGALAEGT